VGLAYHDRLLLLPEFFKNHALSASIDDINNGQKIMQLCYNKFIFHPRNIELSLMLE
jgi:hypothetical protein